MHDSLRSALHTTAPCLPARCSRSAIKNALGDVSAARVAVSLKKAVAAGKLTKEGDSFKVCWTWIFVGGRHESG